MPKNYFVNEGNRIGGQEAQALGVDQIKISASAEVTKGQPVDITDPWRVSPSVADSVKYVGIAANSALTDEPIVVETEGFVKLDADGPISAGDELVCAGSGKVKAKGESVGTVIGIAFSDATENIVYAKLR